MNSTTAFAIEAVIQGAEAETCKGECGSFSFNSVSVARNNFRSSVLNNLAKKSQKSISESGENFYLFNGTDFEGQTFVKTFEKNKIRLS